MIKKIFILLLIFVFVPNLASSLPPKNKWEPTKEQWNKKFPGVPFPKNDCKFCTETHALWAYGWYRKASLMDRDHKGNGGLKKIIIKPASKDQVRLLDKQVKPLPKEIYDFVYYRDISSLMIYEKGKLIHNWKRDYIKDKKPIIGNSRSKSVIGVAAATMKCAGELDFNKTHVEYSPEVKDSYYGSITVKDSLNMMARDDTVLVEDPLKYIQRKKTDIVSAANKYPLKLEMPGSEKFKYSNLNTDLVTLDMMNIAGGKKKFAKWFSENVAKPAGLKSKGKILLDKKGNPVGSSSVVLTRDDWMRFGIYVIELIKDQDSCVGKVLRDSFNNSVDTYKKFAPQYALFFWLNGYGVENLVQMRGYGLRLSLIDWKNDRIIQTNGFAISWKPQELIDLIWK